MNPWTWLPIGIAFAAPASVLIWGIRQFSRPRAENVKYVERITDKVVQQSVVEMASSHARIFRTERLDRHPWYLIPIAAVFCYSMCIFGGAEVTNNVAALGDEMRITMASCFVIGSSFIFLGASLGANIGSGRIMPRVHDHITSPVLGDDITLPYRVNIAGMFAVFVSMVIYTSTSFQTTTGSLGGWLTAGAAVACVIFSIVLYCRTQNFIEEDELRIAEALDKLAAADDA